MLIPATPARSSSAGARVARRPWSAQCLVLAALVVAWSVTWVWAQGPAGAAAPTATSAPADVGGASSQSAQLTVDQCIAEEQALAERLRRDYPDGDETWLFLAQMHRGQGRSDEAARCWEEALKANPRAAEAYRQLGQLAQNRGRFRQAIAYWRKALEIKPDWLLLRIQVADSRMELGEQAEALEELRRYVTVEPPIAVYHYLMGEAHLRDQKFEQAKAYYEKAIALNPRHTSSYYGLFNTCFRLGLKFEAEAQMATFRRLKAQDTAAIVSEAQLTQQERIVQRLARAYESAAKLYHAKGNGARAEQCFHRAIAVYPQGKPPREGLAMLYQQLGKLPQALQAYESISQIAPKDPFPHLMRGIIHTRKQSFAPAEKAFLKVIELEPRRDIGYIHLVRLYLLAHAKLPEAQKLALQAVELNGSAQNHFYWGWAAQQNGDRTQALHALEMAVKLDPANADYRKTLEKIKGQN